MNILNKLGWFIVPTLMFSLVELVGEKYILGYKLAEIQAKTSTTDVFHAACIYMFAAVIVDFVWYELPQNYLYAFYRESFFDRNWFLLILPAYFFRVFGGNPLIYIAVTLVLILANEPFRRWRMKKMGIAAEKAKNLLEHPYYDATKVELKHYTKNFFIRSWFMFVIPWGLVIVIDPGRRGAFYHLILVAFGLFEAFSRDRARKEIKAMLGEDSFLDFTDDES